MTEERVNQLLEDIEDKSEFDDTSDEEPNVNIFGQGLADNISRMPGINVNNQYNLNNEPPSKAEKSKFQHSYLSSIQSIRTIEKEKLNKALQDRMNRLAIMDHNFKVMMNKRFLSQPKNQVSKEKPRLVQNDTKVMRYGVISFTK